MIYSSKTNVFIDALQFEKIFLSIMEQFSVINYTRMTIV